MPIIKPAVDCFEFESDAVQLVATVLNIYKEISIYSLRVEIGHGAPHP
jgi:hypothetical protein